MSDPSFEKLRKNLIEHYQENLRDLMRKEKSYFNLPQSDLLVKVTELHGFLRGFRKAIHFVESEMLDTELPMEKMQ